MNIYISQIKDVVETVEITPTEAQETFEHRFVVPKDAMALAIAVGRIEGQTFSRVKDVNVSLSRNNEPLDLEDQNATFTPEGSLASYMTSQPPRGEWLLTISHKTSDAFVVTAAVFRKPIRAILDFANKHQCRACKVSIRALIYALLAKLTVGAIHALDLKGFAEQLVHLARETLEFLAKAIGVSAAWLEELFGGFREILGIETPWGWLARRICEKLGLCRAGVADD